MNKKGFTLVEILAVIIILSLIITIVATNGFGAFNSTKNKITDLQKEQIEESAKLLAIDIENCNDDLDSDLVKSLIKNPTNNICKNSPICDCNDLQNYIKKNNLYVTYNTLKTNGYLNDSIINDFEGKNDIEIIYKNKDNKIVYSDITYATESAYLEEKFLDNISDIDRSSVTSIEFVDYITDDNSKKIEVSTTNNHNEKVYAWLEDATLYIGSEKTIYAPSDISNMFTKYPNLRSIKFNNFNTSRVTNMTSVFYDLKNLQELDLRSFDTSDVTIMDNMFYNCESLTTLDLSSFDTSNVTSMQSMFRNCKSLTTLDLSSFNTSNVTYMNYMFHNCESLTTLDLSSFNTSNVTNMQSMFRNCKSLTTLNLSLFNTSKVTYMHYMFGGCSSIKELDLSSFNTSGLTRMDFMFFACQSLKKLDLSSFDTSNVSNINNIFSQTQSTTIILNNTITENIIEKIPESWTKVYK